MSEFNIRIKDEAFFNNGKIILKSLGQLETEIRESFNRSIEVKTVTRRKKGHPAYEGISADDLNKVLRECVSDIQNIKGETHVRNGIFFPVSKEGFDFSIYDENYNFARLYNYYLGYQGILNGDTRIINDLSTKERGESKREWKKRILSITDKCGGINIDYHVEKEYLTVVGEFQFGNWALAYRDIIRLLNANTNPGVDFYIYITATGKLQRMLSEQTVNYEQIIKVFNQNLELIQIPSWIIGLDVE